MPDVEQLARAAYAAYAQTTDYKTYRGEPMPEWDELGDRIQSAWRAAVRAVLEGVCAPSESGEDS